MMRFRKIIALYHKNFTKYVKEPS